MPLPTALGYKALAFFGVLIGAFYAAPYMNLFFLLLSFMGVMAVLSVWWTWRNLAGVEGEVLAIEPAAAGDAIPVSVRASARGRRPRYAVECEITVAGVATPALAWPTVGGDMVGLGTLPALPRGVHTVSGARLRSSYPFGFARCRRAVAAPEQVLVHPAPADLGSARTRNDLLVQICGASATRDSEVGPSGVREFRPGDAPRDVHWKATARRGELAVREWEASTLAGIEICLDLRAEGEELEHALSVVTALAHWARDHKELLSLASQGHRGNYGEGHRPWRELMGYLARAQSLPADAPPPPATSPDVLRLPARGGQHG